MTALMNAIEINVGVSWDEPKKVITLSGLMYDGLAAQPTVYVGLRVPLTTFNMQRQALITAQSAMAMRGLTARSIRDGASKVVCQSMESYRGDVQNLIVANPSEGVQLAKGAAFEIEASRSHALPPLRAKTTTTSGTMLLLAVITTMVGKTSKSKLFQWQWSTNGGAAWNAADSTAIARTEISGLPTLVNVTFRFRVKVGSVWSDWSQPVQKLVT